MLKFNEHSEAKKSNIKEEKYKDVSYPEAAWLALAKEPYKYEMKLDSWKKDNRMGVNYLETMQKFEKIGLCKLTENEIIFNVELCDELVNEKFGSKTLQEAFEKCYTLKEYQRKDLYGYSIDQIPLELYLRMNPNLEKSLDRLRDLEVDWFNHWDRRTMEKIEKNRKLKELNLINAFRRFYPERIPQKLTIYRGLKRKYDKDFNDPNSHKYSSWTLDPKQAERFAKYHFTSMPFGKPDEASIQTIIKTEVNFEDILMFYGGEESEVVMKNPVENIEILHKKGW